MSVVGFNLGGPEAIIILVIVLVLFGGGQIPKLARNLGRAQREFQQGIDEGQRSVSSGTGMSSAGGASSDDASPAGTGHAGGELIDGQSTDGA